MEDVMDRRLHRRRAAGKLRVGSPPPRTFWQRRGSQSLTAPHVGHSTSNSKSAPFVELDQAFTSRLAAISSFVDQLMRFIQIVMGEVGIAKETEEELEIAIHEALANAVIHGNREDPKKQVHVACRCSMDGGLLISVRDEGEGFDSRKVPDPTEDQRMIRL